MTISKFKTIEIQDLVLFGPHHRYVAVPLYAIDDELTKLHNSENTETSMRQHMQQTPLSQKRRNMLRARWACTRRIYAHDHLVWIRRTIALALTFPAKLWRLKRTFCIRVVSEVLVNGSDLADHFSRWAPHSRSRALSQVRAVANALLSNDWQNPLGRSEVCKRSSFE